MSKSNQPNLVLFGDRVLVKANSPEEHLTRGGIILPQTGQKDKALTGEVSALAPQIDEELQKEYNLSLSVGDSVIFSQMAGIDILYEGQDYKVLRITDVIAKILPKIDAPVH